MSSRSGVSVSVLLLALSAASAQARPLPGIVVFKNGEVIVGNIRADEDTQDQLIVRWPYKAKTERGEMRVPKARIRWYDRTADEPTDAYWRAFEHELIDDAWLGHRERWRDTQTPEVQGPENPLDLGVPPWEGKFADARVSVMFKQSRGGFSGTVTVGGRTHPARGTVSREGRLAGRFEVDGTGFEISAAMEGQVLVLTSGATTYRLERLDEVNPLDTTAQEDRAWVERALGPARARLTEAKTGPSLARDILGILHPGAANPRLRGADVTREKGRLIVALQVDWAGGRAGPEQTLTVRYQCTPRGFVEALQVNDNVPSENPTYLPDLQAWFVNNLWPLLRDCGATPAGVDLSHLQRGQRFTYVMQGGVQMVWTITDITADNTVKYTTQTFMDLGQGVQPVGDPIPTEFPHAAPIVGGNGREAAIPAGTKISRERVRVGTVEFDCMVSETGETKAYISVQGEQAVFPGCIKAMQGGGTVMELVRIETGAH